MRTVLATLAGILCPALALAQGATTPPVEPISGLMFFTFGAALIVAIGALLYFLRKRSNRDAAARVLDPNHPSNQ